MGKPTYVWNGSAWVQVLSADAVNGQGVPTGGTSGQFLKKTSSTDYADEWSDLTPASTSTAGVVQLTDSISSTSITTAATPNSVKTLSDASILKTIVDAKGDLIVATAADTVARLAAGTDGYVLTADSSATEGVKWSPELGVIHASGYYYTYLPIGGGTNLSATKDRMYLVPFYVTTKTTYTRIATRVETTAGSTGSVVRLGIYDSDSSGLPGSRLLDAGTVSSTTTGTKSIAISQSLSKGLYYLAVVAQVATTQPTFRVVSPSSNLHTPQGTVASDDAGATVNNGWYVASITGALPTDCTGRVITNNIPAMYLGI